MSVVWRVVTDFTKRYPGVLRVADRLGRGRGRARVLDGLASVPPAPRRPSLAGWQDQELAAAWIGHATVLLRIGGKTILTDPVFSSRIGLGVGLATLGPRRYLAPALSLEQLPPLDLILITHAHFDHLDRPTLQRLPRNVPVVTAPHTSDLIDDIGFTSVAELAWGQPTELGALQVLAHPTRHWGARSFFDQDRGYNSYVLQAGQRRVLFSPDSAYGEHFRPVGKVDLAIMGIGAYDPYIQAHANPEQVWQMADHVSAEAIFPVHHSTFRLSHEPMEQPMQWLKEVAGNELGRLAVSEVGGQWRR